MSRRFALLVNPASAGGRAMAALPRVTDALDRLGARYRIVTTKSLEHAASEAAAAADAGETVMTVGGDGLVRPVAGALRRRGTLAVIPAGRGNDFARTLGIPPDPAEAAAVAVDGEERLVDVAEVDGEPYIGIASLGFDSEANRIANEARLLRGNLVYLYAALRAIVSWKPATFTFTLDGERRELVGWTIGVCNSRYYGGGMFAAPQAEIDDGRLDVMTCARSSRFAFLRVLTRIFKGTHVELPQIAVHRGEEVAIESDRPFDVYADGDAIARTPARMRVEHRVLRVLVPPGKR